MARKCPVCGSADTAAALDNENCHSCGALFNANNEMVEKGLGDSTRRELLRRLEPRQTNLVGNLADLHRLGAMLAPDPSEPAFVLPAGVNPDDPGVPADDNEDPPKHASHAKR